MMNLVNLHLHMSDFENVTDKDSYIVVLGVFNLSEAQKNTKTNYFIFPWRRNK